MALSTTDWKRIARLLKEAYAALREEALSTGVDIFSSEYTDVTNKVRDTILARAGFTLEEYNQVKNDLENARAARNANSDISVALIEQAKSKLEEINNLGGLITREEVTQIAHDIAKEYIVAPVVTNQIIKETTKEVIKEKPQIIETTRVVNIPYDDKYVKEQLSTLSKVVSEIKPSESLDKEKLLEDMKQFFNDNFGDNFQHNIDIMGMPDWRKLAMGLQGQIDAITASGTGGGHIIQDEGVSLTQRAILNFTGAGVTATDSGGKTVVTIPGGGSSITFVDNEVLGTGDDSTVVFNLAGTPTAGSVHVYVGGIRQLLTTDYSISVGAVTFVFAPPSGLKVIADYRT